MTARSERLAVSSQKSEEKSMCGRIVVCLMLTFFPLTVCVAEAQQPTKVPQIGYLAGPSISSMSARTEAFRQGLREVGYVEGKNIIIKSRYAEGQLDRLPLLATELVRLKVDVIVTTGPTPTRAAKEATVTVPIVMTQHTDPVGSGLVASLARPGETLLDCQPITRR